eukprot:6197097-Pleurochrysis_carterae.AAC.2
MARRSCATLAPRSATRLCLRTQCKRSRCGRVAVPPRQASHTMGGEAELAPPLSAGACLRLPCPGAGRAHAERRSARDARTHGGHVRRCPAHKPCTTRGAPIYLATRRSGADFMPAPHSLVAVKARPSPVLGRNLFPCFLSRKL